MTELSDALQGQSDSPPGFSRTLLAAASTVNHLVFCHQKSWLTCLRCKREVKQLQAVIEAVTPHIEEEARASVLREQGEDMRRQAQRLAETEVAPYLVDGLAYAGDGLVALANEVEVRASVEEHRRKTRSP